MAQLLEVKGLTKRFGGLTALDGITLSVERGEIFSIIGPNGSGKTTFFNVISGIYDPTAGEVWLHGREGRRALHGLGPHQITACGVARTFQTIRLFPRMSVLENLLVAMHTRPAADQGAWKESFGHRVGALFRGAAAAIAGTKNFQTAETERIERARELLGYFRDRLLPLQDELADSLNYADRRRLEIARAMATGAELLLLDEPAAGMNPTEREELLEDIKRLRERGYTVMVIEHDMSVIGAISDRVAAFDHGNLITMGPFDEVRRHPQVVEAYLGRGAREAADQEAAAAAAAAAATAATGGDEAHS